MSMRRRRALVAAGSAHRGAATAARGAVEAAAKASAIAFGDRIRRVRGGAVHRSEAHK